MNCFAGVLGRGIHGGELQRTISDVDHIMPDFLRNQNDISGMKNARKGQLRLPMRTEA